MRSLSSSCSRRDLLRAGLGMVACPLLACRAGDVAAPSASPPPAPSDAVRVIGRTVEVLVARVPAFAAGGEGPVAVVFLDAGIIVVRNGATAFAAFSTVCPHAGCGVSVVQPPRLRCPCHGSEFDFTGARREGPATSGLTALATSFDASAQRLHVERAAP